MSEPDPGRALKDNAGFYRRRVRRRNWGHGSMPSQQLGAMANAAGSPSLIVIGIALAYNLQSTMRELCSVTDESLFIDASGGTEAIAAAFEKVASMISGGDGLVMEAM